MKYRVYMENVVNYYLDVEASTYDEAEDEAMIEGLPGLMFLNNEYPDEGEWEVVAVEELGE